MRNRALLYPAFFLSGVCGLVYQVIWVRQLSLLLGNTTEAVATVLAAFMLGLSIGSAVAGRVADRAARPLRLYGGIEIAIGCAALAATYLFDSLGPAYRALARSLGGYGSTFALVRFGFAFATVTVPTALMGATLPVVARARLAPGGDGAARHVGGEVGRLYALNTLGAALGCALAGFWALGHWGLHRTALAAAIGNIAIGVAVALAGSAGRAESKAEPPSAPLTDASAGPGSEGTALRLVWLAVIASGFIGLALEGIWTRVLQFSVGSSAYAFSLMLAVFLVGLAIGSAGVSRFADRVEQPVRVLGRLAIAHGVAVAACLVLFLPATQAIARFAPQSRSFVLRASLVALALMGPPTLLLGTIFPLGTRLGASLATRVGRDVGQLYMLNTLGSIAGSLATAFVGIPLLGTETSLFVLAIASAGVGAVLLARSAAERGAAAAGAVTVAAVVAVASGGSSHAHVLMPLFSAPRGRDESPEPVFFREGRASTVSIHRYESFRNQGALRLYTNGTSMTGTFFDGQRYMKLLGHLPVLMAKQPDRVLTICFGTGMTFGATALHPEVKEARCAELSATVLEAAPLFASANGEVLARPKARVTIGDGRQVLLASRDLFDVITAEPPPPRQAGTYQLYSREFYQLARERLTPGGVIAQWLPLHDQSELEVRMSVKSFIDVFPSAQLWLPHEGEGILIGSPSPLVVDPAAWTARWDSPEVAESLRSIGFDSPAALIKTFVMGPEALARYARTAPALTDDRPLTDFFLDLPDFMEPGDVETLLAYTSPLAQLAGLSGERGPFSAAAIEPLRVAQRSYEEGVIHNVRERIWEAHLAASTDTFYSDTLSISPWQRTNLEQAIATRPTDLSPRLDLVRVQLNAHDYEGAVQTLEKVTEGAPQFATGWFDLGWALELGGHPGSAANAYRKAAEVDPRMKAQTDARLAVLTLLPLLSASPADADGSALRKSIDVFAASDRIDLAIQAAERDLAARPDAPDAAVALANLLIRTGRHDRADEIVAAARARFPGDESLALASARNDLALGHFDRVIAELAVDSPAGERCLLRAQALRELGNLDEARAAYDCAAKSQPEPATEVTAGQVAISLAPR